jgi:hypothetical protein
MAKGDPAPGTFKVAVEGSGLMVDTEVDQATALAVVNVLMGGNPTPPAPLALEGDGEDEGGDGDGASERSAKPRRRAKRAKGKAKAKRRGGKTRRKKSVGLVKDLSLRPKGKKSFPDFVKEKRPTSQHDKHAVCVYWLTKEAGYKATPEAVNTCHQGVDWKRPADLRTALRLTASKKGWIDTADSADITITTSGEDHVRYDLPKPAKK